MTPPQARGGGKGVPGPGTAVVLLLAVALLFLSGGVVLPLLLGQAGLLLAQIAFILLPALLVVRLGGFDATRTLSLRLPGRRQLVGAILFLLGGLQIALVLAWLQSLVLPVPSEYLQAMSDVLRADSFGRFLWLVLLAALVPAVAEETLFRGVLLSSLRQRLPTWLSVVVVGLVFGLFHLTPETAFRFVPTAWLGILLSWVVVASGSLPLSMLLHFLNNAIVITLTAIPLTGEAGGPETEAPPIAMGTIGAVLLVWGFVLLRKAGTAPREGGAPSPSKSEDYGAQPYR